MTKLHNQEASTPAGIRGLQLRLTALWSACWLILLALASWSIASWHARALASELDGDLGLIATGTYGLTWFDEQGFFETSSFDRELDFTQSPFDISVVNAEQLDQELLRSGSVRYSFIQRAEIAAQVRDSGEEYLGEQFAISGEKLRVHAIPTFLEDSDEQVHAIIFVAADMAPSKLARDRFLSSMWLILFGLGAFGIILGAFMSRISMAPLARSFRQREYFLAAAAHELRNPLAALRSTCESLPTDFAQATSVLRLANETCAEASAILDDLLLFARLDFDSVQPNHESLRLDLLIEQCLPEPSPTIQFEAEETTIRGDSRLLTSLIQNLIRNASKHGAAQQRGLSISLRDQRLIVQDHGSGYPESVLRSHERGDRLAPSTAGTGLGLSLCAKIARAHGTELVLRNRPEGGAHAEISFRSAAEFSQSSAS